ncbi:glycosylhydrolase-like jelly roll fold domain-containing protein [Paenibacillus hodogayensis]|uniref:Glycosylhydrolase-like jelly roll fold domain-containing protein n=1 Tax=Paenibacillus hodogayensis TaxID=279208 RepID=A0ABV5VPU4_9BACL
MHNGNKPALLHEFRQQFVDPGDEYSPLPFWFWNDQLHHDEIVRQLRDFYDKGVAGCIIHPRLGLSESIPYLSDIYMDYVETAVREAARLGMKVMLYDEAMYPSGAANGKVVEANPAYASRALAMKQWSGIDSRLEQPIVLEDGETAVSAQAVRHRPDGTIDLATVVKLAVERNTLVFEPPAPGEWSVLLFVETWSFGKIRGVYEEQDDGESLAPRSADLLNPDATAMFIQLTHEAYYRRLHPYFGDTIIAMFTDEPNILGRGARPNLRPWTYGFLAYAAGFGVQEHDLAALWLEAGECTAAIRASYQAAIQERMLQCYYRPLSDWCAAHRIQLTGHPGHSDEIGLLDVFQLPGQDIVWRYIEPGDNKGITGTHSTMGKCSSDAARHRGRRRNMNECFGACYRGPHGWNLPADDIKWYMDWLFVRGVNLLVPHAFYYSLADFRKHERPPDVGPNSIWWSHYKLFSGYMRRMSWLMTDSFNVTSVAVLCEAERLPWEAAVPLYEHQIEFNYLEEQLLHRDCRIEDGTIRIERQCYTTVILDQPHRFRPETRDALERFARGGGTVLVLEQSGTYAAFAHWVRPEERIEQLKCFAARPIRLEGEGSAAMRVSVIRKSDKTCYVLVNEGEARWEGRVTLRQRGYVERWEPWHAETVAQPVERSDATMMSFTASVERRQAIVYVVDESLPPQEGPTEAAPRLLETIPLSGPWIRHLVARTMPDQPDAEASGQAEVAAASVEAEQPAVLQALSDWMTWPHMAHLSGTVLYETVFDWNVDPAVDHSTVHLDLGTVEEMAEAELNGVPLGVRFWQPYAFHDISAALRTGSNTLRVRVTNSLANGYDNALLPSGLLGPVVLQRYENR